MSRWTVTSASPIQTSSRCTTTPLPSAISSQQRHGALALRVVEGACVRALLHERGVAAAQVALHRVACDAQLPSDALRASSAMGPVTSRMNSPRFSADRGGSFAVARGALSLSLYTSRRSPRHRRPQGVLQPTRPPRLRRVHAPDDHPARDPGRLVSPPAITMTPAYALRSSARYVRRCRIAARADSRSLARS